MLFLLLDVKKRIYPLFTAYCQSHADWVYVEVKVNFKVWLMKVEKGMSFLRVFFEIAKCVCKDSVAAILLHNKRHTRQNIKEMWRWSLVVLPTAACGVEVFLISLPQKITLNQLGFWSWIFWTMFDRHNGHKSRLTPHS